MLDWVGLVSNNPQWCSLQRTSTSKPVVRGGFLKCSKWYTLGNSKKIREFVNLWLFVDFRFLLQAVLRLADALRQVLAPAEERV